MKILSGKQISEEIQAELKEEVDSLKKAGISCALSVILVGADPASIIYVNNKKRVCEKLGINFVEKKLPEDISQPELLSVVRTLNGDPSINGFICQVPLPPQCDENEIVKAIDPEKDADCFHPYNLGALAAGTPRFMPCTPFGILQILQRGGYRTAGKEVVILGRSNIVGRPLSILLSLKGWDATVTVCHSRSKNLPAICQRADILIAAVGSPGLVTEDFVKEGAVVIDVGTNRIKDPSRPKGSRLAGDVDFENVKKRAGAITPVPGGVGPMTVTMLMLNTINAARLREGMEAFYPGRT